MQSDGDDLAFAHETTWLDHNIEVFDKNYNSTHAHLVVWVKIPILATNIEISIA